MKARMQSLARAKPSKRRFHNGNSKPLPLNLGTADLMPQISRYPTARLLPSAIATYVITNSLQQTICGDSYSTTSIKPCLPTSPNAFETCWGLVSSGGSLLQSASVPTRLDRRQPFFKEPCLRTEPLLQVFYGLLVPHLRSTNVKFEFFVKLLNDSDVQETE